MCYTALSRNDSFPAFEKNKQMMLTRIKEKSISQENGVSCEALTVWTHQSTRNCSCRWVNCLWLNCDRCQLKLASLLGFPTGSPAFLILISSWAHSGLGRSKPSPLSFGAGQCCCAQTFSHEVGREAGRWMGIVGRGK